MPTFHCLHFFFDAGMCFVPNARPIHTATDLLLSPSMPTFHCLLFFFDAGMGFAFMGFPRHLLEDKAHLGYHR